MVNYLLYNWLCKNVSAVILGVKTLSYSWVYTNDSTTLLTNVSHVHTSSYYQQETAFYTARFTITAKQWRSTSSSAKSANAETAPWTATSSTERKTALPCRARGRNNWACRGSVASSVQVREWPLFVRPTQ